MFKMTPIRFPLKAISKNYFLLFSGMFLLVFFLSTAFRGLRSLQIKSGRPKEHSSNENKYFLFFEEVTYNETKVEMERRKSVLLEVCKREALGAFSTVYFHPKFEYPPTPNYEAFYFDREHSLAWCPIYKSASTSWLHNFCLLGGLSEKDITSSKVQISKIARGVWPSLDYDDGKLAIDEAKMKFFIVRHPFERLLSAYRDKLENKDAGVEHGTFYFYRKYGKNIAKKYRDNNVGDVDSNTTMRGGIRPEPTFQEFVRYLIDINLAEYADEHWMPYYLYCTPCSIEYDVIAKFETLSRDQNFILTQAKLESKIKPVWKHKTRGRDSASLIKKYFSTVTKSEGLRLYEKYQLDFEMFEYSLDDYKKYFIKN